MDLAGARAHRLLQKGWKAAQTGGGRIAAPARFGAFSVFDRNGLAFYTI
jgi:hypothetical protein